MQLLGNYASKLNSFYYAQLLSLVSQSIALGEYSGGAGFDTAAVTALQEAGQDFSSIAQPSAGYRILDDNFNQPLNLLTARFTALQQEVTDFNARATNLIAILEKETTLLDQLIAAAEAESWSATLPQLGQATQFAWDFSGGYGAISGDIPQTDPSTGILYTNRPSQACALDTDSGIVRAGITPTFQARTFVPSDLEWTYTTDGQEEDLSGTDWAEISILEPLPTLIYASQPTTSPDMSKLVQVVGKVAGGVVPITVNLIFVARSNTKLIQFAGTGSPLSTSGLTNQLTPYSVQSDTVAVVANGQVYQLGYDFTVSDSGLLTSVDLPAATPLTVYFTEYFPAYQCSVNQTDWSSTIMLDPARPYPDGTTNFLPIALQGAFFPITDELGVPTGLSMRLLGVVTGEQKFQVTTPASTSYGERVTLTITPATPAYMTGLTLSPFATYPAVLNSVVVNGPISDGTSLFSRSVLIDRETTISFPRCAVRQLVLTFTQENYTLKEYSLDPPDQLRRDTLASLQSVLPFAVRNTPSAIPTELQGALYEFGFENIQGVDLSPQFPCVFVTGPYRVTGTPELVNLTAVSSGSVSSYLSNICYSSGGQQVDIHTDTPITSAQAIPVPLSSTLNPAQIGYTDFYVKFVLSSSNALVERFFLQASTHV